MRRISKRFPRIRFGLPGRGPCDYDYLIHDGLLLLPVVSRVSLQGSELKSVDKAADGDAVETELDLLLVLEFEGLEDYRNTSWTLITRRRQLSKVAAFVS